MSYVKLGIEDLVNALEKVRETFFEQDRHIAEIWGRLPQYRSDSRRGRIGGPSMVAGMLILRVHGWRRLRRRVCRDSCSLASFERLWLYEDRFGC